LSIRRREELRAIQEIVGTYMVILEGFLWFLVEMRTEFGKERTKNF